MIFAAVVKCADLGKGPQPDDCGPSQEGGGVSRHPNHARPVGAGATVSSQHMPGGHFPSPIFREEKPWVIKRARPERAADSLERARSPLAGRFSLVGFSGLSSPPSGATFFGPRTTATMPGQSGEDFRRVGAAVPTRISLPFVPQPFFYTSRRLFQGNSDWWRLPCHSGPRWTMASDHGVGRRLPGW